MWYLQVESKIDIFGQSLMLVEMFFLITLLVDSVYSVSPRGINELHHTKNTIQYPNPMIPCRRGSVVLF